jgi:hypothetical protein
MRTSGTRHRREPCFWVRRWPGRSTSAPASRPDDFAIEGLAARVPVWIDAVRLVLTFPPSQVTAAADLGLRLFDCGMPNSAGELLGADSTATMPEARQ